MLRFVSQCFEACSTEFSKPDPSYQTWFEAIKAIHVFRKKLIDPNIKVDFKALYTIIVDINRAFVLYCCSMVNMSLQKHSKMQNFENAVLHWTRIAVVDTLHLIKDNDPHFAQVILNLESSL